MKDFNSIKRLIKKNVTDSLSLLNGISSLTFVGSFEASDSITSISDIDIVLIVDHLDEPLFHTIRNRIQNLEPADCGLPGYSILVNTSFGPLKFNDANSIVFHLMIYDLEAHRKHVNESPFTCFDWEQYHASFGSDLADIYPVLQLQLSDLFGSRRSLGSYLDDVEARRITYREYKFSSTGISEQVMYKEVDARHQKEYAFHIMKFMMINTLKIFYQENISTGCTDIAEKFAILDPVFGVHIKYFLELANWKLYSGPEPEQIVQRVKIFIEDLEQWLISFQKRSAEIFFFRHAKTTSNDGSFLGQGRNPGIMGAAIYTVPPVFFDRVITSSLRRAVETGTLLSAAERSVDAHLDEINYGEAEGMNYEQLVKDHPAVIEAWAKGLDPSFPGGENQGDVADRLSRFLSAGLLPEEGKKIAVVTHNVVLRALLGKAFNIPVKRWHLIQVEHLEYFHFRIYQNKLYSELETSQRIKLRDQVMQWKNRG